MLWKKGRHQGVHIGREIPLPKRHDQRLEEQMFPRLIAVRVFALVLGILTALPALATDADIAGRASVIDGDTIEIDGTRIRFDGIDAPESRQICLDTAGTKYRCGQQSALALDDFLAASRPTICTPKGKSWDRIVATCRRADGEDVSAWMVRNGHAVDWPKYSKGRYAAEQREAQASGAGMWAGQFEQPCIVRKARCD
ncbi:thermonuclease family protein [Shinella sp.]|uniref:thermonuclease family protein n=1 Tax=Shinella sp. TaxID=1870904 RepID=UPI002896E448|nr:thermonuclease family protein [Shinella sp.]